MEEKSIHKRCSNPTNEQENGIKKCIKATAISVVSGLVMVFILLFLFSFIILKVNASDVVSNVIVLTTLSLSGLIAGYANGRILKRKGMLMGLLAGGVLLVIFTLLSMFCTLKADTGFFSFKLLVLPLFATFGGMVGVNKAPKRIKF